MAFPVVYIVYKFSLTYDYSNEYDNSMDWILNCLPGIISRHSSAFAVILGMTVTNTVSIWLYVIERKQKQRLQSANNDLEFELHQLKNEYNLKFVQQTNNKIVQEVKNAGIIIDKGGKIENLTVNVYEPSRERDESDHRED